MRTSALSPVVINPTLNENFEFLNNLRHKMHIFADYKSLLTSGNVLIYPSVPKPRKSNKLLRNDGVVFSVLGWL